jgi:hypothetical protein
MVYFHVIVTRILGLIIYYLIIVIFIQDLPSVKLINLLFVSIKSFPMVITLLETLPLTLKVSFLSLSPEALIWPLVFLRFSLSVLFDTLRY